jgi:uncharacterized membrane protein AbrB (regulator of aidB expression)
MVVSSKRPSQPTTASWRPWPAGVLNTKMKKLILSELLNLGVHIVVIIVGSAISMAIVAFLVEFFLGIPIIHF